MVNPAVNVALIAAAAKKETAAKALKAQLSDAGATSAARAIPLAPASDTERSMLTYALSRGTIREAGGGRYWLDKDRQAELRARARTVALVMTAGLLSALASLVAILASR